VQTKEIAMATVSVRNQKAAATPIRVTLPVSVACDLERFQAALANVAAIVGDKEFARSSEGTLPRMREFVIDRASLEVKEATVDCNEAP
jgi:hypothetical protein